MTTGSTGCILINLAVVEAYRLDRYDNLTFPCSLRHSLVVEAYRLDRYDNSCIYSTDFEIESCRSLSFG